tara:strand:+ start:117 stop:560 length:444 start_codon:yes stop_codon:yes gene_type:complete
MSYIKTNLNNDEKLKYHSRISIKPIIINFSLLVIVSFIAGYVITDWFLGLLLAIIVFVLLIPFALIAYFGSEFGVTGERVISKKGIISRNVSEMNLSSIESVNVDQGIIERIINVGSLKISGRGTTSVNFSSIDDPIKVRKLIQNKS